MQHCFTQGIINSQVCHRWMLHSNIHNEVTCTRVGEQPMLNAWPDSIPFRMDTPFELTCLRLNLVKSDNHPEQDNTLLFRSIKWLVLVTGCLARNVR